MVTFWVDCTEADEREKVAKMETAVLNEQNFSNYVLLKDYRNAILLALAMAQPGRLLSLFTSVRSNRIPPPLEASLLGPSATSSTTTSEGADASSITGSAAVDQVLKTLPGPDLVRLLGHVRDWNARAKTSPVAQTILHAILRLRTADDIVKAFDAAASAESVVPVLGGEGDSEEPPKRKPKKKSSPFLGEGKGLSELLDAMVPYTERHFERAERMVQESFVLDFALSEMDGGLFGMEFDQKLAMGEEGNGATSDFGDEDVEMVVA